MKIKWLLLSLTAIMFSACDSSSDMSSSDMSLSFVLSNAKNFGVVLEAKPAQKTVKVQTKAQGWKKSGKKNGYIGMARGESGITIFTVKGEDIADDCAGDAKWVITELRLATEGKPADQKGSNFGKEQPAWLAEAFPGVDLSNGVLFDVPKSVGQTFLPVFNANQQVGEKTIYYEVALTNCDSDDDESYKTDPAWGNGGRR